MACAAAQIGMTDALSSRGGRRPTKRSPRPQEETASSLALLAVTLWLSLVGRGIPEIACALSLVCRRRAESRGDGRLGMPGPSRRAQELREPGPRPRAPRRCGRRACRASSGRSAERRAGLAGARPSRSPLAPPAHPCYNVRADPNATRLAPPVQRKSLPGRRQVEDTGGPGRA
jgi:hypothetical protein